MQHVITNCWLDVLITWNSSTGWRTYKRVCSSWSPSVPSWYLHDELELQWSPFLLWSWVCAIFLCSSGCIITSFEVDIWWRHNKLCNPMACAPHEIRPCQLYIGCSGWLDLLTGILNAASFYQPCANWLFSSDPPLTSDVGALNLKCYRKCCSNRVQTKSDACDI
jgi:hypothetical protein